MRAAFYLRRSTEEHQQESLDTQRSEAERFIKEKGWSLDPDSVFIDDAISRGEFVKRPGIISALNAAGARRFDVLVTRDETRLGGDMLRTGLLVQDFIDSGVKLIFYATGEEVRVDDATQKFVLAAKNYASELEREKTSQRTAEALMVKARKGLNVGGRVFGYDNVEVREGERRHVEYRINEEQAEVVRDIFGRFAGGKGVRGICKTLNDAKVLSPRAGKRGSDRWKPSCVWSMLRNDRYRGVILRNKLKKTYRRGTKVRVARPSTEWLRIDVPTLRVVDEDLWSAVAAKIEKNKRLTGRKGPKGQPPKHLLSSIARCGVCGGAMQAVNGKVGSQNVKVYVCHRHRTEGNAACANTLRRPVADVDAAVTDWISANVLREELVVETLHEIRRRLAERTRATNAEIPRLEERVTMLRQELQKLAEALLVTEDKPHTIVRLIADREKALGDVQARLAAFSAAPGAVDLETRRLEREARRRLVQLRALFDRNPHEARGALEALLDGALSFQPIETPDGKRYEITGKIALGSLFTIEGVPRGIRTPVSDVKSRGPGPLDDGDLKPAGVPTRSDRSLSSGDPCLPTIGVFSRYPERRPSSCPSTTHTRRSWRSSFVMPGKPVATGLACPTTRTSSTC